MKNTAKTISSHYMQSSEWASLRYAGGWITHEVEITNGVVRAYLKPTPLGKLAYIPGFMPKDHEQLKEITNRLKNLNTLVCKIEPCEAYDQAVVDLFETAGWRKARSIQYEYTVRLDLTANEDNLWMGMKSRGRQEINYAKRDGVSVEEVEPNDKNLAQMYSILQATSQRKTFGIREKNIMMSFWAIFSKADKIKLFFAKHKGQVIAGGVFITDGHSKVWYKDAGSLPEYSKLFGPRLLLWIAALKFKKDGYKVFDLGGTADPIKYENSAMKGVHIFKTAFTRDVTTMMPAYEMPLKPLIYPIWSSVEPLALHLRRNLSKLKGKVLGR